MIELKQYTFNMKHKAKKSLGQNFLKSNLALNKIIEAGEISNTDTILEIGPGKGALTERLLKEAGNVIAIEKDRNLFQFLGEKFAGEIKNGKLILIEEDILKFNANAYGLKPRAYKIIANIPYNITGAILKKFLTEEFQPNKMVLMVQHEVAQRIVARDKKESILSISVKAYGEPKIIMKVPARYFSPAPKVDSAILLINNISKNFFSSPLEEYPLGGGGNKSTPSRKRATPQDGNTFEEKFWELIHAGFAHKRKKLSGNLKKLVKNIPEEYKNSRAEDLSLENWLKIIQN
jgi:16S rRNA (adenine1518-N6/adenine1519-N6)-dimethyltransferase